MEFGRLKRAWEVWRLKIRQFRVGLRLSILSLVLFLMGGVSVVVLVVGYQAINKILVSASHNYLQQAGSRVAEQVRGYLRPLNGSVFTAQWMVGNHLVDPKQENFSGFLHGLIANNSNVVGAYWGDPQGNFRLFNRAGKGFLEEIVVRDAKGKLIYSLEHEFDGNGRKVVLGRSQSSGMDPRTRQWYLQAADKREVVWLVYKFRRVGKQQEQLGITAAAPVYDGRGKLRGVLGIDLLLGELDRYVKGLELTANSVLVVMEATGQLVAIRTKENNPLALDRAINVEELTELPWVGKAFTQFVQSAEYHSVFMPKWGGNYYLATGEKIPEATGGGAWSVMIVAPLSDITAPLQKNMILGSILIGLSIVVGVILASIFSFSLSWPIRRLERDASLICELKLEEVNRITSRIREIANMANSFIRMRNALHSFQRYMPVALVKKLIANNRVAAVGGEERSLTLLFTDIQDFTPLSEKFDPEGLMKYLSEYFQGVSKAVIDGHGTVDKYIGDGVMAFWGAPTQDDRHAFHACRAALRAKLNLDQLNLRWQSEGKPTVKTRFGVSTGMVVVGNVGSSERLNYTALGDPVNLASRLEGLNKLYGTTLMVSESTYELVKDKFKFRFLDRVAVRGKREAIAIYELLGDLHATYEINWRQYNREFAEAFASYTQGHWSDALAKFQQLKANYPADHRVLEVFIGRCNAFLRHPPLNWDGVWVMGEDYSRATVVVAEVVG